MTGPGETELASTRATVWGEARSEDAVLRGTIETPNPYAFTADSAVLSAARVANGAVEPGFQTPATAFGPDFPLEIPGVERLLLTQDS
ncbi:MAG: hypothetical protein U5K37_07715 [Natrialbaceae archaeon]|nr:hypothetical protein [Natrialbaceae archaeon]